MNQALHSSKICNLDYIIGSVQAAVRVCDHYTCSEVAKI